MIVIVKYYYTFIFKMDNQLSVETTLSDRDLMLRVRDNDVEAMEILYDRYSPLLFPLIKKIVGNQESAEEVLTEVFLIIWKWADQFDFEIKNVYTWMVLLARKKAIDSMKRKRSENGIDDYNDEYEIQNILPKLSPQIKILELDKIISKSDKISNLLNVLNQEQKLILSAAYYKGLEDKTIADKLNIPVAAVKLKLQFTMELLMQKIYR